MRARASSGSIPVVRSRSAAVERTCPTITLTDRLVVCSSTALAWRAACDGGLDDRVDAPRILQPRRQREHRLTQLAQRVGDRRRHAVAGLDRPQHAARQHADVAHREVDLAAAPRCRSPAARAAPGAPAPPRRSRARSSAPPGSAGWRRRCRARGAGRRPPGSRSRSTRAPAMSSSTAASSSRTGAASRRTKAMGSIGAITKFSSSATPQPISASAARVNDRPSVGGCSVTTRIADTAAWVTSSGPPPRKTAIARGQEDDPDQLRGARAELEDQHVGQRDAQRHAERQLDRAVQPRPDRQPERDDRRDRARRTRPARRPACVAMYHAAPAAIAPMSSVGARRRSRATRPAT